MRQMLVVVAAFSVTVCIGVTIQGSLRATVQEAHCWNNQSQLSFLITLYVSRYGSGRQYPGNVSVGGSGAPVPSGPNGIFWAHLYRVPNHFEAVSQRPGNDGLYACTPVDSHAFSTTTLDYSAPNFSATWTTSGTNGSGAPVFPGGCLSEAVRGDAFIFGDLPDAPGGTPTHKWASRLAIHTECWRGMYFDGHRGTPEPGSPRAQQYVSQTTGVRTR
ncbi:MAG: hypothetical protein HYZ53_25555 [Planctomycetes bacterium]|nr:hypothetical protein [Planctomycetota bacterium]